LFFFWFQISQSESIQFGTFIGRDTGFHVAFWSLPALCHPHLHLLEFIKPKNHADLVNIDIPWPAKYEDDRHHKQVRNISAASFSDVLFVLASYCLRFSFFRGLLQDVSVMETMSLPVNMLMDGDSNAPDSERVEFQMEVKRGNSVGARSVLSSFFVFILIFCSAVLIFGSVVLNHFQLNHFQLNQSTDCCLHAGVAVFN